MICELFYYFVFKILTKLVKWAKYNIQYTAIYNEITNLLFFLHNILKIYIKKIKIVIKKRRKNKKKNILPPFPLVGFEPGTPQQFPFSRRTCYRRANNDSAANNDSVASINNNFRVIQLEDGEIENIKCQLQRFWWNLA